MDDERVSFDLNTSLKHYLDSPSSVPCLDAAQELLDCDESPESLTNAQINQVLDPIIDAIAENPEAIARCSVLDSMQWLLK